MDVVTRSLLRQQTSTLSKVLVKDTKSESSRATVAVSLENSVRAYE